MHRSKLKMLWKLHRKVCMHCRNFRRCLHNFWQIRCFWINSSESFGICRDFVEDITTRWNLLRVCQFPGIGNSEKTEDIFFRGGCPQHTYSKFWTYPGGCEMECLGQMQRCPEHRLAEAAALAASCAPVRSGSDLCRATLPITYGESPKIIEWCTFWWSSSRTFQHVLKKIATEICNFSAALLENCRFIRLLPLRADFCQMMRHRRHLRRKLNEFNDMPTIFLIRLNFQTE